MIAGVVQDAKDNLSVLGLVVTVAALVVPTLGARRFLDEGHRQRSNGWIAIALALAGLAVAGSQLLIMASVVARSFTGNGEFESWLVYHTVFFALVVALTCWLGVLLAQAIGYTRRCPT